MFEEVNTFRWLLGLAIKAIWLMFWPVLIIAFGLHLWLIFGPVNAWGHAFALEHLVTDGGVYRSTLVYGLYLMTWALQTYTFVILGEFR